MIEIGKKTQACDELFRHLTKAMQRKGVSVGSTAGYPRAEISSINEQSSLDKTGEVRQISVVIDAMSNKSLGEALAISQENLDRIKEAEDETKSFTILGVTESTANTLEEVSDTQVLLYRVITNITFYLAAK